MNLIVVRITVVSIFFISTYLWGDWKNWKKYYPTMCFFGMGDLIYIAVFHDKLLWYFPPPFLVAPLDELLLIFSVFFPTAILFLCHYPPKIVYQIIYNCIWIGIYVVIEIINLKLGVIEYYNGWNLWWSVLHNTVQFPLIALHHKRPLAAWAIALVFLVVMMKIFHAPIFVKM
jgi:hypothetical protein